MPAPDFSAIARWPHVPACYGWLSLDRRGRWRLQGDPVSHPGLAAFLDRQYGSDERGAWFVQNGPQRVFVSLDYTPWVLHLETDGELMAHTGESAGAVRSVHLDETGSVLLLTDLGIGLLDDRDLPAFLDACRQADGACVDEAALSAAVAGRGGLFWRRLPVQAILAAQVPGRFGYRREPAP
jgi:hypothetical protein